RGDFVVAIAAFEDALALRPAACHVRLWLQQAQRGAYLAALEQRRRQFLFGPNFVGVEIHRRQWGLLQQAEAARLAAIQQAALLNDEQRLLLAQQRAQAQTVLVKQAQLSFQTKNFNFSVSFYESAVALAPPSAVAVAPVAVGDPYREMAIARIEAA